ncbi:MAG: hypothetical protein R8K22_05695 [Mariprofundaceae bacterium]
MKLIWCIRRGTAHGFKNELAACVSCHCRQRKKCKAYRELAMEDIVEANHEAKQNGHEVVENFPLFEAVLK